MNRETVEYPCGETRCSGYFVYNEIVQEPRPAILIAPAWKGQDAFSKEKADALARLGYTCFVADLYGEGKVVESDQEAEALMMPLFLNRQLLRDRIGAAYDCLKQQKHVNPKMIGAIGFCFGGLAAIELMRSGVNVGCVVSFHGVLGNQMAGNSAEAIPHGGPIKGSLLILHGNNDPLVTDNDIKAIQKEFTDAGVDWQMHIYGHTVHAFTNPDATDPATGLAFNEKANARSWRSMQNFFNETIAK